MYFALGLDEVWSLCRRAVANLPSCYTVQAPLSRHFTYHNVYQPDRYSVMYTMKTLNKFIVVDFLSYYRSLHNRVFMIILLSDLVERHTCMFH